MPNQYVPEQSETPEGDPRYRTTATGVSARPSVPGAMFGAASLGSDCIASFAVEVVKNGFIVGFDGDQRHVFEKWSDLVGYLEKMITQRCK